MKLDKTDIATIIQTHFRDNYEYLVIHQNALLTIINNLTILLEGLKAQGLIYQFLIDLTIRDNHIVGDIKFSLSYTIDLDKANVLDPNFGLILVEL